MSEWHGTLTAAVVPARRGAVRDWQRWAPHAAVAWSLASGAMAIYWAVSGRGFPYTSQTAGAGIGPLIGRLGPGVAWIAVMMAGIPAAAMGVAMLRGVRGPALRPLLMTLGTLLAGVLLLLMTGLSLLIFLGYVPYVVVGLFTGAQASRAYLKGLIEWTNVHQFLCLIGGFLWLAATVAYSRRSVNACSYCGRREGPNGWQTPNRAAGWGRIAVYVSMVPPLFYAFTRYAWALGFPLGMTEEFFRRGQARGTWIAGLFLANFGLVGVVLTLGLVQRWGETFPRWMIGLARRRVPIALAVVPASFVSVLLLVGGIGIWAAMDRMVGALVANGADSTGVIGAVIFQVGPTLLFPAWGVSLAVATTAYYYRRRGPCGVCGRGA